MIWQQKKITIENSITFACANNEKLSAKIYEIKSFFPEKDNVMRIRRKVTHQEKIFAKDDSDEGLWLKSLRLKAQNINNDVNLSNAHSTLMQK